MTECLQYILCISYVAFDVPRFLGILAIQRGTASVTINGTVAHTRYNVFDICAVPTSTPTEARKTDPTKT
jgi:hypothetical protein